MAALENFQTNLKAVIVERGVPQRALAEKAEMGYPYVNRVLQGKTVPSVTQAERLAKAVGLTLVEMLQSPKTFSKSVLTDVT